MAAIAKSFLPTSCGSSLSNVSVFQRFLADNACKHPDNTPPDRRQAIEKAFDDIRLSLPMLSDKLHSAVAASKPVPLPAPTLTKLRSAPMPAHNDLCYEWLLSHLHNPYPTREEHEELCRRSGASMKSIHSWFIKARQRIGWSDLRAKCFGRSQINIVEAASSFWPERDPKRPLPPNLEVRFAEIEANARALYSDLRPSGLLLDLLNKKQQETSCVRPDDTVAKKRKHDSDDLASRPTKKRSLSPPPSTHATYTTQTAHSGLTNIDKPSALVRRQAFSLSPPRFGEASLTPSSPDRPLKRSSPSDDAPEPKAKRAWVLPVWNDPRSRPILRSTSTPLPRRKLASRVSRTGSVAQTTQDIAPQRAVSNPPQWSEVSDTALDPPIVSPSPEAHSTPEDSLIADLSYWPSCDEDWSNVAWDEVSILSGASSQPSLCSSPSSTASLELSAAQFASSHDLPFIPSTEPLCPTAGPVTDVCHPVSDFDPFIVDPSFLSLDADHLITPTLQGSDIFDIPTACPLPSLDAIEDWTTFTVNAGKKMGIYSADTPDMHEKTRVPSYDTYMDHALLPIACL
ncbi:hypothetical protein K523DRAFT_410660 [Schizophyllum commune Tattone D]|nr:hypothetical protein K523DRAFT_410660 [Schizophyllum commune Tattone D]